jgi:hypothetical protein
VSETSTPDFYRPGHVYLGNYGWKFRCDTITIDPKEGVRVALGWRHWGGEWEPYAYYEDDWDIQANGPLGAPQEVPTA